jgi:hypothetical protein
MSELPATLAVMAAADQYVESIIAKYAVARGPTSAAERFAAAVVGPIRTWAGAQLNGIDYSGSYAKETGVHGISDVDLFVSLKSNTNGTLKDLYDSLFNLCQRSGWAPRPQNVSIGVTLNGTKADLVPGRVQDGFQNYHSLYLRKRNSWTQTNVALHVKKVRDSGRQREIRALKTWKVQHSVEWPSLYLELFTIDALSGRSRETLADNVIHVLRNVALSITAKRIEDPANTNNVISEDLTANEKQRLAAAASSAATQPSWGKIIW